MHSTLLAPWFESLASSALAVASALTLHHLGRGAILRALRFSTVLESIARRCDPAARAVLSLAALQIAWNIAPDSSELIAEVRHGGQLLLIAAFTWMSVAAIHGASDAIAHSPSAAAGEVHALRARSQVRWLARTAAGGGVVSGASLVLMTFPGARQIGASLLASAGGAGHRA